MLFRSTTDLPVDPNDSPNAGPDWDGNGRVDFLAAVTAVDTNLVRAPVAPRRMAAAPAQAGTLLLLWTDDTGNEEGYRVERATFVGGQPLSYDVLGIVGPNVTQFEDATVVAGATYFYRIVAFNLAGETTSRARRLTWR